MSKPQQNSAHPWLWRLAALFVGMGGLFAIGLGLVARTRGADQITALISALTADGRLDDNYTHMLRATDTVLLLLGGAAVLIASLVLFMQRWASGRSAPFADWSSARFLTTFGVLSLTLNLVLIAFVPFTPWDDFQWYHQSAIDLLHGIDVTIGGHPTATFAIGYPIFLVPFYAVFGPRLIVAQILNVLLRLGTAASIHAIALQATGRPIHARVAFILVAFFPSLLFYTLVTCSDVLFMAICVLILRLMIPMDRLTFGRTALLGLLVGYGSLVRPVLLLFPVVILIWYAVLSRKPLLVLTHLVLVLVVQGVVLAPWAYRNTSLFGQFVPISTIGGYNLYIGHNPAATGGFNSVGLPRPPKDLDEVARDRWYREQAIAYIRGHPGRLLPITAKKMLYLFMRDDQGVSTATKRTYTAVPAAGLFLATIVSDLFYLVVLGLAVLGGVVLIGRGGNRRTWLLLFYCAYHLAVYLPFFGMDRYHLPILPILSLLAVLGGGLLVSRLQPAPASMPLQRADAGM